MTKKYSILLILFSIALSALSQKEYKISFVNRTIVKNDTNEDVPSIGIETSYILLANDTSAYLHVLGISTKSRIQVKASYPYSKEFILNQKMFFCSEDNSSCINKSISYQDYKLTGNQKKIAGYDCIEAKLLIDSTKYIWICKQIPYTITCLDFVVKDKSGGILEYQNENSITKVTSIDVINKNSTFLTENNIKE